MLDRKSCRDRCLSPCAEVRRRTSYSSDYRRTKNEDGSTDYSGQDCARDVEMTERRKQCDSKWDRLPDSKYAPHTITGLEEKHQKRPRSSQSSVRVERSHGAGAAIREGSSFFSSEPRTPKAHALSRQQGGNRAAARSRSPEWSQLSKYPPFPIYPSVTK